MKCLWCDASIYRPCGAHGYECTECGFGIYHAGDGTTYTSRMITVGTLTAKAGWLVCGEKETTPQQYDNKGMKQ